MLWMRRPCLPSIQNSRIGCQSIAATRSALNVESARRAPLVASMRATSGGLTALPQFATITGAPSAPPTCSPA